MPGVRQGSARGSCGGSGLGGGGACGSSPGCVDKDLDSTLHLLIVGIRRHEISQEILKAGKISRAPLNCSADLRDHHLLAFPVR